MPPDVRLSWVWAAPFLGIGFLGVASVAVLLPLIPIIAVFAAFNAAQGEPVSPDATMMLGILIVMLFSFPLFAACSMFWAKVFERRSMPTLGFSRGFFWRYGRGLIVGVIIAGLLLGASQMVAPEETAMARAGFEQLMQGGGLILLLVLFFVFVIQSGSEEVVYRGWMLSSITARRGPMTGVVVSSIGFGIVHAHYLAFAPLSGLFAVVGVGLIGAVLAFYALGERSIWGACGAHCAYNFIVTVVTLSHMVGTYPDRGPMEILRNVVEDITSVGEFSFGLVVTVMVLAALTVIAWIWWKRGAEARTASV